MSAFTEEGTLGKSFEWVSGFYIQNFYLIFLGVDFSQNEQHIFSDPFSTKVLWLTMFNCDVNFRFGFIIYIFLTLFWTGRESETVEDVHPQTPQMKMTTCKDTMQDI